MSAKSVRKVSLLDSAYNRFFKVLDQDGFAFTQMRTTTKKDKNWHAFYFQPSIRQALGYALDKTNPTGVCTLVCFDWLPAASSIPAFDIDDRVFGDGSLDGTSKAVLAKSLLGLPEDAELMPALQGVLFLLETDTDKELVVSQQCFTPEFVRPRVLAQLKFWPSMPFVSHWRIAKPSTSCVSADIEFGEWRRCSQAESDDPTKLALLPEWKSLENAGTVETKRQPIAKRPVESKTASSSPSDTPFSLTLDDFKDKPVTGCDVVLRSQWTSWRPGVLFLFEGESKVHGRVLVKVISSKPSTHSAYATCSGQMANEAAMLKRLAKRRVDGVPQLVFYGEHTLSSGESVVLLITSPLGRCIWPINAPSSDVRVPAEQFPAIAAQCAVILDQIHAAGIIHRDVWLNNIILSQPTHATSASDKPDSVVARFIDFGIAQTRAGSPNPACENETARDVRYSCFYVDWVALALSMFALHTGLEKYEQLAQPPSDVRALQFLFGLVKRGLPRPSSPPSAAAATASASESEQLATAKRRRVLRVILAQFVYNFLANKFVKR